MDNHITCEGGLGDDLVHVATAPGEARLVVINLRGAMDGLDAVQPYGDPALRALRGPDLSVGPEGGAFDLDGFFALHPALETLMPLWRGGQLSFIHAVSTPYRDKRSHFDGQDLLATGSANRDRPDLDDRTGFLNRLVACIPGATLQLAWSSGAMRPLIANGPAPFSNWSPTTQLGLTEADIGLLRHVYGADSGFALALESAVLSEAAQGGKTAARSDAAFVARQLVAEARIATFSIDGWDTHAGQAGIIAGRFRQLAQAILTLRDGLGPVWDKTVVVVVTEFGRTARANGTGGTDHGTGGVAFLAGGAVRGGKVHGRWPGLTDLYAGRDLMPTADVRDYLAAICHAHLGVPADLLSNFVFPGASVACGLVAA